MYYQVWKIFFKFEYSLHEFSFLSQTSLDLTDLSFISLLSTPVGFI